MVEWVRHNYANMFPNNVSIDVEIGKGYSYAQVHTHQYYMDPKWTRKGTKMVLARARILW